MTYAAVKMTFMCNVMVETLGLEFALMAHHREDRLAGGKHVRQNLIRGCVDRSSNATLPRQPFNLK
jgi:hypothetical protein